MKRLIAVFLFPLIAGCSTDDSPTAPAGPARSSGPADPQYSYVDITGYSEALAPGYAKAYSDGSWDVYGGNETVNGQTYLALIASDSTRYYYTPVTKQYAGYRQKGAAPVVFDAPQGSLPAKWVPGGTVYLYANFTYSGYHVSTTTTFTLIDTNHVTTPLGTFSKVAHFSVQIAVNVSSGDASSSSQEIWLACGPGGIEHIQNGGTPVYFDHGFVNGVQWGTSSGVKSAGIAAHSPVETLLKGIIR